MPIYDIEDIVPYVIIVDSKNKVEDLNLQLDDVDEKYSLECVVKVKSIMSYLENNTPRHQYRLELEKITKFEKRVK